MLLETVRGFHLNYIIDCPRFGFSMAYEGQTAFVTGGASGIARALTQRLVDQG